MKQLFFYSQHDWTGLVLRITAGLIMFPHGAQKLFGWFGGYGFHGTMNFFMGTLKLPWLVSFLVIMIESIGAASLVLGLATRVWSIAFIVIMMGAIYTTNAKNGFFMNWFGNQPGEGYEYHLLLIGLCAALFICGSGRYALDELF